jgi:hypothetical protein
LLGPISGCMRAAMGNRARIGPTLTGLNTSGLMESKRLSEKSVSVAPHPCAERATWGCRPTLQTGSKNDLAKCTRCIWDGGGQLSQKQREFCAVCVGSRTIKDKYLEVYAVHSIRVWTNWMQPRNTTAITHPNIAYSAHQIVRMENRLP